MRALVFVLAVLAAAKIWTQTRLYKEGAEDALIRAYGERAKAACQIQQAPASDGPLWTRPAAVALEIGRRNADVHIWEFDHALWPAKYKHPHVVLMAKSGDRGPVCEYDVIEGRAYLAEL